MHPGETLASNDKQRQQNLGIQSTEQQLESENTKQNKSKSNTTDKEIQVNFLKYLRLYNYKFKMYFLFFF